MTIYQFQLGLEARSKIKMSVIYRACSTMEKEIQLGRYQRRSDKHNKRMLINLELTLNYAMILKVSLKILQISK
jgi:hypothetical protein